MTAVGNASLAAQRPLLDGGEGELLQPYTDAMDIDTHIKQEIPPMDANTSSLLPLEFPPNIPTLDASNLSGLEPPSLDSTGGVVTGADTPKHRIKDEHRRKTTLANQALKSQWKIYQGEFELPVPPTPLEMHRGEMCPSGLALLHPVADLLKEWATYGCPTNTGMPWMHEQMQAAVDRGPHWTALTNKAIVNLSRQARGVGLHQGQPADGTQNLSNSSNTCIIHAFAEAEEDAHIFMAKWVIKDWFWRLDAEDGTEWNFSYVLPQHPGQPCFLMVVPTSLQMGWVESPPFFCAASETARDVAQDYCETKMGTLPPHKFTNYVIGNQAYEDLPERDELDNLF